MRLWPIAFVLLLAACSPEQSRAVAMQPKKTLDSVHQKLDAAAQKEGERVKEQDEQTQ